MRKAVMVASVCLASGAETDYAALWSQFKEEYGKSYETNAAGEDEESRFKIFKANVDSVNAHNANGLSYTLGLNEFADLTPDEFASIYIGGYRADLKSDEPSLPFPDIGSENLNDTVDWVAKGGVTPVKDQKRCGSCWAFSTTGSVEGAVFAATGKLISLSEENLVQCDWLLDHGCNGGLMDHAFGWVKRNGICSEEDYPYTSGAGERGTCRTPKCQPVVHVQGHVDVPARNEDALKAAVAKQPVSVAIEADRTAFQLYKGGVIDSSACGTSLDHGVLVVGYGTDNGKDYWKVKNSWGATWGESGYVRLARGKNMCGISQQASYPTGASVGPSPGPAPSPPGPPGVSHYENPKDGCQSDESDVHVVGFAGSFCAPSCSAGACPTDVPEGVTASPVCAFRGQSGDRKCGLRCTSQEQCGPATCRKILGLVGICTYDSEGAGALEFSYDEVQEQDIII